MSGHSKWQNFESPNPTATRILKIKNTILAQFWHNFGTIHSIKNNKEQHKTIKN